MSSCISCSKENAIIPYGFLNLRVEQEEDIKWETITSKWIDTLYLIDLRASSYYLDSCIIPSENITGPGIVSPLALMNFLLHRWS